MCKGKTERYPYLPYVRRGVSVRICTLWSSVYVRIGMLYIRDECILLCAFVVSFSWAII